ncbi:MAG: hypothetical protein Kow00108_05250 [Calditrichia bacterium]
MIEKGIVIDATDKEVKIMMGNNPACGGCNACSTGENGNRILTVHQQIEVSPGDKVEVDVHPASPYISFLSFFAIPLVMMFLFFLLFKWIIPDQVRLKMFLVTLGTLAGLLGAVPVIRKIDTYFKNHENDYIKIKRIA